MAYVIHKAAFFQKVGKGGENSKDKENDVRERGAEIPQEKLVFPSGRRGRGEANIKSKAAEEKEGGGGGKRDVGGLERRQKDEKTDSDKCRKSAKLERQ